MGPIMERAKRIEEIKKARKYWLNDFPWRNHVTASHEFQVIDTLRDIRSVLTIIALLLFFILVKL